MPYNQYGAIVDGNGRIVCARRRPDGEYLCSLDPDHSGSHSAHFNHALGEPPLAKWSGRPDLSTPEKVERWLAS